MSPTLDTERPSICLCMIVRDEVDVLGRCLDSCRELIDSWVICDTGSTDGTQELIGASLDGIPGELHEQEWVDFGHNRSELMRLAHGKADYLLLLDADTTLQADPEALRNLQADSYLLRHDDHNRYYTKRLVSGRLQWRYVGAVHEYITSEEERTSERLEDLVIRSWSVGGSRKGRWERDAQMLEGVLERDPGNVRSLFYLAQTYRDLGNESGDENLLKRARELYERRGEMGGWAEESYWALHQAGILSERLGEWPTAADFFMRAWERRPERLEAVQRLTAGLRTRGEHRAAHQFAQLASGLRPLPMPEDILFLEPWVYEWGMLFEYSITAYWCKDFNASILACKRLLGIDSLPEGHQRQTNLNLAHAFRARAQESAKAPPATPRPLPHTGTPTKGLPATSAGSR